MRSQVLLPLCICRNFITLTPCTDSQVRLHEDIQFRTERRDPSRSHGVTVLETRTRDEGRALKTGVSRERIVTYSIQGGAIGSDLQTTL